MKVSFDICKSGHRYYSVLYLVTNNKLSFFLAHKILVSSLFLLLKSFAIFPWSF